MTELLLPSRLARVAVVGAGLALAVAAGANAIGNAPLSQMPAMAAALRSDSELQLIALDQEYLAKRRFSEPAKASAIALQALRDDPLNARAIRTLGLAQPSSPRSEAGQKLFRLSNKVSRREDLTQLSLMEAAVMRNDAAGALRHFDIFMRTNPQGQAVVFPLLARALAVPEIRQEISRHLVARSPWVRDFVSFASSEGGKAGTTADIVLAAGRKADPAVLDVFGPALVTRLVEAGEFERAVRMLALLGGERSIVAKGAIDSASTAPRYGSLSWQLVSEGNRAANFTVASDRGRRGLAIYAAPGAIGAVASKILALPPGRHVMVQAASAQLGTAAETARWTLKCAGSGNADPFWTGHNLVSTNRGRSQEILTVPAGCPYQELTLRVEATTSGPGIDLTIEEFAID